MQQSQPVAIGGTCGKHVFISSKHSYSYLGSSFLGAEMTADTSATSQAARTGPHENVSFESILSLYLSKH